MAAMMIGNVIPEGEEAENLQRILDQVRLREIKASDPLKQRSMRIDRDLKASRIRDADNRYVSVIG